MSDTPAAAGGGGYPNLGQDLAGIGSFALSMKNLFGGNSAKKMMREQMEFQAMMAQNGIQWRVQDAQKAGIHPLYALGANVHAASPVSVMDNSTLPDFQAMGQGLQSIIDRVAPPAEKAATRLQTLTENRMELENQKLATEIALLRQPTAGPQFPQLAQGEIYSPMGNRPAAVSVSPLIPGQGSTDQVEIKAAEPISARRGLPSDEAGDHPDSKWLESRTGGTYMRPGAALNLDDMDITNPMALSWLIENRALPFFGKNQKPPPDSKLPRGAIGWRYRPLSAEWEPVYNLPKSWQSGRVMFHPKGGR